MPQQELVFSQQIQTPPPDRHLYQPASSPSAESIGLNRLLNSPHGSYVLQWQAAHSPQPLRNLQKQFPILKEATIVQYQRNNKFWYVLLDGPFKDRQTAMDALQSSPRAGMMNQLYPWTRSIASIQKLNLIRPQDITPNLAYEPEGMAQDNNYSNPDVQNTDAMFASISPAYPNMDQLAQYPSIYDEPAQPQRGYQSEPDHRYKKSKARSAYQERNNRQQTTYSNRLSSRQKQSILEDSAPGSYTIQWLASHKKATLVRVQKRYAYLGDTEILQYRKRGKKWYVLISKAYDSQSLAKRALEQPTFARMSTRLYPRVRSVESLRQLTKTPKTSVKRQLAENTSVKSILNAPKDGYTIQWFAANKPEAIQKMKQRFPELASAVTVHYRRNKKDWYVLLQGQFGSSSEALDHIKSPVVKDAAQVLYPWTRPVNSLKKLSIQES